MERQQITGSSNISSAGHDPDKKILEVEFLNGDIYQYSPITSEGFQLFMNAPSKGKFIWNHIRNNKAIDTKKLEN